MELSSYPSRLRSSIMMVFGDKSGLIHLIGWKLCSSMPCLFACGWAINWTCDACCTGDGRRRTSRPGSSDGWDDERKDDGGLSWCIGGDDGVGNPAAGAAERSWGLWEAGWGGDMPKQPVLQPIWLVWHRIRLLRKWLPKPMRWRRRRRRRWKHREGLLLHCSICS